MQVNSKIGHMVNFSWGGSYKMRLYINVIDKF